MNAEPRSRYIQIAMLLQENHLAVTGSFPPVENRTAVARGLLGVGVDYMVGLQPDAFVAQHPCRYLVGILAATYSGCTLIRPGENAWPLSSWKCSSHQSKKNARKR